MALIPCDECKREISSRAAACPHCGCPVVQAAAPAQVPSAPVPSTASASAASVLPASPQAAAPATQPEVAQAVPSFVRKVCRSCGNSVMPDAARCDHCDTAMPSEPGKATSAGNRSAAERVSLRGTPFEDRASPAEPPRAFPVEIPRPGLLTFLCVTGFVVGGLRLLLLAAGIPEQTASDRVAQLVLGVLGTRGCCVPLADEAGRCGPLGRWACGRPFHRDRSWRWRRVGRNPPRAWRVLALPARSLETNDLGRCLGRTGAKTHQNPRTASARPFGGDGDGEG